MMLLKSILLFLVAGIMEIGGGYLMWLWLREKWAWWIGAAGALVLVGYGVVPTLQPAHFGRVYAAYGGVFVVLSIFWGWWIDGIRCRNHVRASELIEPADIGTRFVPSINQELANSVLPESVKIGRSLANPIFPARFG
jgi:small multidrug resistance family-3 protein